MSWDELGTRGRQEVSKRFDVTMCKLGLQPGRQALRQPSRPPGRFFFSKDELGKRVSLLRERLPHEAANIIEEANQICRHRFRLLGFSDLDYGSEIDWHLDAVHGLRSPLIPWFKINFLDFSQVGDHKIAWELSRHQHLVTLAKAWLLTSKEAYAREILVQWYSWQRANPYPLGANWASSLEVAFRSLSWIWVHHLLAECPVVTPTFQKDLLRALALNGRHIERYLSTYFSPNTHLLGEAVALFFIGTLYPQLSSADRWRNEGWRITQHEALRQVRLDGGYFEQSLYYHVYALDFFLHARLLASQNELEIPSEFDLVIRKMLAVVQTLSQNGPPDGFGDDDGGRVFAPRRNRSEHMSDPLAVGAALFHDESSQTNASLTEESIWLFGEKALSIVPQVGSGPKTQSYENSGLYILGSSEPFPQQMIIDAGPQGTGRSGHGHADALSVKLAFCGRSWLVDAGTFCYIGPGDDRNIFRGTRAHNTLTVDGLDQAEPDGPFAWNFIPKVQADIWIPGNGFTLFAGSHSGYERIPQPVRHRRFVFHLHGGFWLVRDIVEGEGSHLLETSWHFAPDLEVSDRSKGLVAAPARDRSADPDRLNCLKLLTSSDPRWKLDLLNEYVSPVYGEKVMTPAVHCSAQVELPAEHAVLLVPAVGGTSREDAEFFRDERQRGRETAPEAAYLYKCGNVLHGMIFSQAQKIVWNFGPWTSNARFLYFRTKDRRVDHLVFCDGSSAQLGGASLVSHGATLQWLEWTYREGPGRLGSSDEDAARSFSASVLGSEVII
jgi:hypothetical protein